MASCILGGFWVFFWVVVFFFVVFFLVCLLWSLTHVSLFQKMYVTSSARPQFITTFPSTGTVSSSGYTSAMKETSTSATQSSPSFCRYTLVKSQSNIYNERNSLTSWEISLFTFLAKRQMRRLTRLSFLNGKYEAAG